MWRNKKPARYCQGMSRSSRPAGLAQAFGGIGTVTFSAPCAGGNWKGVKPTDKVVCQLPRMRGQNAQSNSPKHKGKRWRSLQTLLDPFLFLEMALCFLALAVLQ